MKITKKLAQAVLTAAECDRLRVSNAELLAAAKKFLAFYDDLSKSNPGFMGKLCLQDYAQWNEAMMELPRAIANAEKSKGAQ